MKSVQLVIPNGEVLEFGPPNKQPITISPQINDEGVGFDITKPDDFEFLENREKGLMVFRNKTFRIHFKILSASFDGVKMKLTMHITSP